MPENLCLSSIDNDGDGVAEHEELVFSFDASVPQSYNGYSLVNNGDEIGLGYPEYEIIDAAEFASRISNHNDGTITATDDYYIVDDDVYLPIPVDYDLDGRNDWGRVLDENHDGIPDASLQVRSILLAATNLIRSLKPQSSSPEIRAL